MEWNWLILIIVLLIIESLTFNLVAIWFAVGALGAFIATYFTTDVTTQIIVFTAVTIVSLVGTRPIVKKYISVTPEKTNAEAIIGKTGTVLKEIKHDEYGRVKVNGQSWMAKADHHIEEGTKVEILKIDGVKLVVKEREEK